MTTTAIETEATQAADASFKVTVQAAKLVEAVRNVAPFTCKDVTLPSICGVYVELSADGKLTLVSTDRYVLAITTLDLSTDDAASHSGEGAMLLTAECVKALSALKPGDREPIVLTVSDGTIKAEMFGTSLTWRDGDADRFPRKAWPKLYGEFKPCATADLLGTTRYNPEFLARFAKIRDGGRKAPELTLEVGEGLSSRFECGPVSGIIMRIRIPS